MLNEQVEDHMRRCEPRFRPFLEEVLWRPEGETCRPLRGCLRDVSHKGISLLTGGKLPPGLGSELQVHLLGTEEIAPYEIVWVEQGQQLAAVGCRRVEPATKPASRKRRVPPRLLASV